MSIYSDLNRVAADIKEVREQVKAISNAPQSQRTSVEGGSIDFNDDDGNLMAIIGGQDDGSNTIRHVDGPTPPVPSGLSAHVDGPIVQVSWDGTFEDADTATHDWSHLEVIAVGPSNEQLTATINDITGASTNLAATASGDWTVVARSVSRAEKRSVDGDAGTVTVELVGLTGAINDAIGSANGKNTVTYSETAPTPADEGIAGDTWWVGSVAETDPEDEDPDDPVWLITAQYQFLDGGWQQTELDHQVIATLDLGKATVGELDGVRIMGRTIRGEQLSGDAIDGKVITGATYRTSDGTGEWSDDGLFISQPDGTSMVRFPTDGSPLSLTASDVRIDRASVTDFDVVDGAVRSGGTMSLTAGVTAPTSPPELTTGWQKFATLPKPAGTLDVVGLAYWGSGSGFWVRAINILGTGEGDRIELYDYATGELDRSIPIGLDPQHGLTVIGNICYLVGKDHARPQSEIFVFGYDLNTGARTSRARMDTVYDYQVAVGNDGTNMVVASVTKFLNLYVGRWNPVTGVSVGVPASAGVNTWPASGNKDLCGVSVSGNDVTVVTELGGRVYTNTSNVLTRKTDANNASGFAGWINPNKNGAGYVTFGTLPVVIDGQGGMYSPGPRASDVQFEACYTWWDGVHETTPSPVASVTLPARNFPLASLPVRAGLQKRLYSKLGGNWIRLNVPESQTAVAGADIVNNSITADPPTTNTFPNANPAVLRSSVGNFRVDGNGAGTWGPLTFNADGTMTGGTRIATGSVSMPTVPAMSGNSPGKSSVAVTFPPGRFTTPPSLTAMGSNGRLIITWEIGSITATSAQINGFNVTGAVAGASTVTWTATEAP